MTPRTGRPPTTGEPRPHVKHIRLSDNDVTLMQAAADRAGQTLALWMHTALVAAANAKPRKAAARRSR